MFAFAEKYNTVLKVLLGLIALSFVVVGVESYSDADSPNDVARVGGEHITRQDLARYLGDKQPSPALRDQAL
ncbi:MAG: SurA N-terminal domain-containing protein, partial [Burkholderiales bacterium]